MAEHAADVLLDSSTTDSDSSLSSSDHVVQPGAFTSSQHQMGEQQWSASFLQAYLQTKSENVQPDDDATLALTQGQSSHQLQPPVSAEVPVSAKVPLAESLVAWGYYVAGAAVGSFLGLKQGMMR